MEVSFMRGSSFPHFLAFIVFVAVGAFLVQGENTHPATTETETIVFLRHGEKPANGLGQLTAQGLNRALGLVKVLSEKFGKPDRIFAPDPAGQVLDSGTSYFYVRPLVTIEPTAIHFEMPVETQFKLGEIDKLDEELTKPKHARYTIFVAWEHGKAEKAAAKLMTDFGGDPAKVPHWPGDDYDSLYIIKLTRTDNDHAPKATFILDHEGLDKQSKSMPTPAP
jgi:broad specificity phosphatase PhoE